MSPLGVSVALFAVLVGAVWTWSGRLRRRNLPMWRRVLLDVGMIAGWCVIGFATDMTLTGRVEEAMLILFGGITVLELTSHFVGKSSEPISRPTLSDARDELALEAERTRTP